MFKERKDLNVESQINKQDTSIVETTVLHFTISKRFVSLFNLKLTLHKQQGFLRQLQYWDGGNVLSSPLIGRHVVTQTKNYSTTDNQ